ncbi:hypothetical protein Bhyg_09682 [Pseudolycoriella hygida]|uniref:Uncharacterized protein n=1 Tax=Pseudolycoriella hygida TaxID=35572 RepID=A0A9Q0MS03_9DIPT|nr:hypothetical protein Bhyg_09682 [Pseudolycoriella hygida]
MDYMPEMIAQLCFLPSGLFMGYIFYVFEFANLSKLENITYFPYIIGFSAAFLIALLYSAFKSNKRQELYQQFHILIGCSVLYIVGGTLFMFQIEKVALNISNSSDERVLAIKTIHFGRDRDFNAMQEHFIGSRSNTVENYPTTSDAVNDRSNQLESVEVADDFR